MSFCRCQYLANSTEDEFIKKKNEDWGSFKKNVEKDYCDLFPISILPFSTKNI